MSQHSQSSWKIKAQISRFAARLTQSGYTKLFASHTGAKLAAEPRNPKQLLLQFAKPQTARLKLHGETPA